MVNDEVFGNPEVHERALVLDADSLIGKVIVKEDVFITPNAVLRADEGSPFFISKGTNIQDGVVFHGLLNRYVMVGDEQYSIFIGSHCSIAHGALIHGPTVIQKKTFIGFRAIIHFSQVGERCFIGHASKIINSEVGNFCHVGIGAIISGVKIASNRLIDDGVVVNTQRAADLLPRVPDVIQEEDNKFNHEVVDYNKELIDMHKRRRSKA